MRIVFCLLISLLGFRSVTNAQIPKGSFFLGGSMGFDTDEFTESTSDSKSSSWNLQPQLGKAIRQNQVFGIYLSYGRASTKQQSVSGSNETHVKAFGGGLFFRHYHGFTKRFYLFANISAGYRHSKSEGISKLANNFISSQTIEKQASLSLAPGLSFAATRKLFLEASLNNFLVFTYRETRSSSFDAQGAETKNSNGKSFSGDANAGGFSNITIGVRWILPRKGDRD